MNHNNYPFDSHPSINVVNSSENNVYQHLLAIYKHVGRSCRS